MIKKVIYRKLMGSEEHTSELQSRQYLVCRLLLEKTIRSEEHTSELQSRQSLVCRLLLEKKISFPLALLVWQLHDENEDRETRAVLLIGITVFVLVFFLMIRRPRGFTLFPSPGLSR